MATDSILGLFTTPEQYQQAQTQQLYANQLAQARLSPVEQASFNIGAGAQRFGNALGGMLGAEDPQMKLAGLRQQILKGVNPQDMKSIEEAAIQFSRMGDGEGIKAMQELAYKQSQITKNLREVHAAGTKLQEVGVAEGTREPVYTYQTPQGVSQVVFKNVNGEQQMVPFTGGVDRTTAKTNIGGIKLPEGESEFVKELGKLDAKKVTESLTARDAAIKELGTLQKMAEVVQRPVISGSFAEQRADVSNFFNTIGLSSNADKLKTANSQEYIKYSTGLVLDNLKKTGYNPSNRDMQIVQSIIPRLETDPTARKELITFMAGKAKEVVDETTRLEQYARSNRGLSGFTPKIPLMPFTSSNPYSTLSDAELAAKIAAARAATSK